MINEAITVFVENLGGETFVFGVFGLGLAFVIVISLIDYIID